MKSLAELEAIRQKTLERVSLRKEGDQSVRIVVGMATCGIAAGARPVLKAFSDAVQEKNLENIMVVQSGCIGLCQYEPIVEINQPGKDKVTYVKVTAEKAAEIIDLHLIGGEVVTKYPINSVMK